MESQSNNKVAKVKILSYDIAKSNETIELAIDVAKFIKENKLYHNIQGKEFVNVEGWQYAGSRLGILPIVREVTNISTDQEMKFQARVELLNLRTEQIIGAGFAICSNKESGKKFYQEFAIASMAQTRAIGKAYRNILAWIIRAAGYEPTPAEEMDYLVEPQETKPEKVEKTAKQEPAPVAAIKKVDVPAESQAQSNEAHLSSTTRALRAKLLLSLNKEVFTQEEKDKVLSVFKKKDDTWLDGYIKKLNEIYQNRAAVMPPTEMQISELKKLIKSNLVSSSDVKMISGLLKDAGTKEGISMLRADELIEYLVNEIEVNQGLEKEAIA